MVRPERLTHPNHLAQHDAQQAEWATQTISRCHISCFQIRSSGVQSAHGLGTGQRQGLQP